MQNKEKYILVCFIIYYNTNRAIRDKLWNLILLRDEGRWRKATTPTRSKEDNLTVIKDEKDLNKSDESKLHAVARNDKLMKMMDDQQFGKRLRSGEILLILLFLPIQNC